MAASPVTVGVDLDNVLYPFAAAFRSWTHERTGRPLSELPWPTTWAFWRLEWGMADAEYQQLLRDGVRDGRLFSRAGPEAGAVGALGQLQRDGARVLVVTARGIAGVEREAAAATCGWLAHWAVPHDGLIITDDKAAVGLDCLVDDSVEQCDAVEAAGGAAVVFDRPWNRSRDGHRALRWGEVPALVAVALR